MKTARAHDFQDNAAYNDALMLIDRLNFSVAVNDNALAIETLEKLIVHKDIENKNEYKSRKPKTRYKSFCKANF